MGLFNMLFGGTDTAKVDELLAQGAKIIDVRTPAEFKSGHNDGAINIPLDTLQANISRIKEYGKPIVLVCLSGGRAGSAKSILSGAGIECVNAGGWSNLR